MTEGNRKALDMTMKVTLPSGIVRPAYKLHLQTTVGDELMRIFLNENIPFPLDECVMLIMDEQGLTTILSDEWNLQKVIANHNVQEVLIRQKVEHDHAAIQPDEFDFQLNECGPTAIQPDEFDFQLKDKKLL